MDNCRNNDYLNRRVIKQLIVCSLSWYSNLTIKDILLRECIYVRRRRLLRCCKLTWKIIIYYIFKLNIKNYKHQFNPKTFFLDVIYGIIYINDCFPFFRYRNMPALNSTADCFQNRKAPIKNQIRQVSRLRRGIGINRRDRG